MGATSSHGTAHRSGAPEIIPDVLGSVLLNL
jgi:hypothetical protein